MKMVEWKNKLSKVHNVKELENIGAWDIEKNRFAVDCVDVLIEVDGEEFLQIVNIWFDCDGNVKMVHFDGEED